MANYLVWSVHLISKIKRVTRTCIFSAFYIIKSTVIQIHITKQIYGNTFLNTTHYAHNCTNTYFNKFIFNQIRHTSTLTATPIVKGNLILTESH